MNDTELAELKARVDANDPESMFVYAEFIRTSDKKEADKFLLLAAQLGNPKACEKLGDRYMEANDPDRALHYYRIGAKGGIADCSVKTAVINLSVNEHVALRELEELAESGVKSACSALAAYYKALGNRKQYNFWRSLAK